MNDYCILVKVILLVDTDAIIGHDKYIKNFFHNDLSRIDIPIMLTASLEDEFAKALEIDFTDIYRDMIKKLQAVNCICFVQADIPL